MPQLMPLNWLMSVFMLSFLLFMLIKMYYMMEYKIIFFKSELYYKNFIWLW